MRPKPTDIISVHMHSDPPPLVPELDVTDLAASQEFYVGGVGFVELYGRPEEAFLYLRLGGADLMLQLADGPGRRFRTGTLERPFGRGMNLQIEHPDLASAHRRLLASGVEFVVPLESRSYRTGNSYVHVEQFVVSDPDGYLVRLQHRQTPVGDQRRGVH